MEELDIVDENDTVIGKCTRHESYEKCLTNRIVDIVIINTKGEIALQKRSKRCGFLRGAWATSAGGHVGSGQEYEDSAYRELQEELGINIQLKFVGKYFRDRRDNDFEHLKDSSRVTSNSHSYFTSVFEGKYEGDFHFNDGEVEEVKFFSQKELRYMIDHGEYMMTGLIDILERYYLK